MKVLVTGGAGYIGSHTVERIVEAGHEVVVLDDLSAGARANLPANVTFVEGNAGDARTLDMIFETHSVTSVLHLAASISIGESISDPAKYHRNNVLVSQTLLAACAEAKVKRFVFASSAAVYGEPVTLTVSEDSPASPISPYGASKLATEKHLTDAAASGAFDYCILRYFNVVGRTGKARDGDHLIRRCCEVARRKRAKLVLYGKRFETKDGTAIRDYIHVVDIARANLAALERPGKKSGLYNCGSGNGTSVKEVIEAVEKLTGNKIEVEVAAARAGEISGIIADSRRIAKDLGWKAERSGLEALCETFLPR